MISSIKGSLADCFGVRVLPPEGIPDVIATIKENGRESELRLYSHDSKEIKISTFRLIERIVHKLFQCFLVVASTSIALLGFVGIINAYAPLFVFIGVITSIVSICLYCTSWYCDNKFKLEVKENNLLSLVKLDKDTWVRITTSDYSLKLKDNEDNAKFIEKFKLSVRNDRVYIPQAELDIFLAKSASPKMLFSKALDALKHGAVSVYTTLAHRVHHEKADNPDKVVKLVQDPTTQLEVVS